MAQDGFDAGTVVSAESVAAPEVTTQVAAPVSQESKPVEKTFTRDQVAVISNNVKNEAYDKARKEFEAKSTQVTAGVQSQADNSVNVAPQQATHNIDQQIDERVNARLQQEQQKLIEAQHQAEATKVYNAFSQKMQEGKGKYEDFEKTVNELFVADDEGKVSPKIASIVAEATYLDNTADVMYELAKNPQKLASIAQLQDISFIKANAALKELSNSIKANKDAVGIKRPNTPLSQIQPSPTGADNGVMTAGDLRRHPDLKA